MRFYTSTHQYYCGIDLHTRVMYLCIIRNAGEIVLHRNMKANPESLLKSDRTLQTGSGDWCGMHLHLVLDS
jgi:hypothetical protein